MAELAGVEPGKGTAVGRAARRREREERRLTTAAEQYSTLERTLLLQCRRRLRALDLLEAFAGNCLLDCSQIGFDAPNEQVEFWWSALARLYAERWSALAAWLLLAFGTEEDRQRFVLYPNTRPALLAAVLDSGGLVNDNGHWRELVP